MDLPDVNVLIYAHREDAAEHDRYAVGLRSLVEGASPFGWSSVTLSGFLRIVSNPRIFDPATPMELALGFCRRLIAAPTAVLVRPGARHWAILDGRIEVSGARGALVSDAYLAALALEHGCDLVRTDGDFARFPDLRWRHHLAA